MNSPSEGQARRSSEVIGSTILLSPNSKAQVAWKTVKSNFIFKSRSSMPNLRRWLSSSRTTESNSPESNSPPNAQRRLEDEKESLFCETLLGLMRQTGRFEYIDFTPESRQSTSSSAGTGTGTGTGSDEEQEPRAKRFSWSR